MQVSWQSLFVKMEQQLKLAQQTNGAAAREHIAAVRALCDVILESGETTSMPVAPQAPMSAPQVTTMTPVRRTEEEGNGDSLFDF